MNAVETRLRSIIRDANIANDDMGVTTANIARRARLPQAEVQALLENMKANGADLFTQLGGECLGNTEAPGYVRQPVWWID